VDQSAESMQPEPPNETQEDPVAAATTTATLESTEVDQVSLFLQFVY